MKQVMNRGIEMSTKRAEIVKVSVWVLLCTILLSVNAIAEDKVIDLESDSWMLTSAQASRHVDRRCLVAFAHSKAPITDAFGGGGFASEDSIAAFQDTSVKKVWETADEFLVPECVIYDAIRNVLYVSNFDMYNRSEGEELQFISKVSSDGEIQELKWITGLNKPTGMAIFQGKLFVVERANLVEIDIESGQIVDRHAMPQPMFPNDAAVDTSGNVYVSDSRKNVIFRLVNGTFEEWLKGDEIEGPNGLHVHNGKLIVGNNGDSCLKSVDVASKEVSTIAKLGPGIIDGIRTDEHGNYIVSHWEGRVYRISSSGEMTTLLDTSVAELNSADLEYIVGEKLLVIPTFAGNTVVAYQLIQQKSR